MREIIQLSFGKESNHIQAHFWNFEDEKLKAGSGSGGADETQGENESTSALYYEKPSSGQMVPRAVMHDYRDNFGNFSACFALDTHPAED